MDDNLAEATLSHAVTVPTVLRRQEKGLAEKDSVEKEVNLHFLEE